MYLSNINSKEDKLQKVHVCKKGDLQKCKSTSYLQSTLSECQNQAITMTFAVAVLQGEYAVGHIPGSRVFKSCLVLQETWRRDHVRNHWQKMPRDIRCPFPGRVSNWQSHNSHKRVLKMPHVVVAVVSISWNSTYWLLQSQDGHKRVGMVYMYYVAHHRPQDRIVQDLAMLTFGNKRACLYYCGLKGCGNNIAIQVEKTWAYYFELCECPDMQ